MYGKDSRSLLSWNSLSCGGRQTESKYNYALIELEYGRIIEEKSGDGQGLKIRETETHMTVPHDSLWTLFLKKINLFILIGGLLLYSLVVVLPYIDMNQPWMYMLTVF